MCRRPVRSRGLARGGSWYAVTRQRAVRCRAAGRRWRSGSRTPAEWAKGRSAGRGTLAHRVSERRVARLDAESSRRRRTWGRAKAACAKAACAKAACEKAVSVKARGQGAAEPCVPPAAVAVRTAAADMAAVVVADTAVAADMAAATGNGGHIRWREWRDIAVPGTRELKRSIVPAPRTCGAGTFLCGAIADWGRERGVGSIQKPERRKENRKPKKMGKRTTESGK